MEFCIILILIIVFFVIKVSSMKSVEQASISDERKSNVKISGEVAYQKMVEILSDFPVSGVYYRSSDAIDRAISLQEGEEIVLIPEPENSYDVNAIKVMTKDNYHIGYIPRGMCQLFNKVLIRYRYTVFVNRVIEKVNVSVYIRVEIQED